MMTAVPSDPAKTVLARDYNRDWENTAKPQNKQSCNDFTVTDSNVMLTAIALVAEEGLDPRHMDKQSIVQKQVWLKLKSRNSDLYQVEDCWRYVNGLNIIR